MTNEQREAIDRLRRGLDDIWFATLYSQEEMDKDIDKVLSLTKEQQEEMENITTNYKNLIADVSGIAKDLGLEEDATIDEIYTAIRILKSKRINVIEQLDCIKRKDKQIDLMAKYIDKIDVSEDFCEGRTRCDEDCENCIKQYFERKVEDVKD